MARAKVKTVFFCKECGYESTKWMGQCPGCGEWNTLVEEKAVPASSGRMSGLSSGSRGKRKLTGLFEVSMEEEERMDSGIPELNRVLGGGIVKGSLILVGGDPGIGKSTLLLQICRNLANDGKNIVYVSGEESLKQIKMRADRLGDFQKDIYLLCETDIMVAADMIREEKPDMVVVDSVQTMSSEEITSAAGSISQVREVTSVLMQLAKEEGIAVFIVGHVTKEGVVAGPKTLEHMVDTVLYFEGEQNAVYRILRGVKNRFGSTNEIGVFEMKQRGLFEVSNPSQVMLDGRPLDSSGSVVVCSMEGTRPLLIEIQALVSPTSFNMPRRTSVGIDFNRVNLLLAVLEKRAGMQLGGCDAYVNLAGGMRLGEPAIDLGIVCAVISSYRNIPVHHGTMIFGEVGLTGEVRGVGFVEQRLNEAIKMGFTRCIIPKTNVESLEESYKKRIQICGVSNVREVIEIL
ncbi:MAG: DNA repair protein RadA [Clostridiales bacterium]|nr:DNA repair protein RadA [Clostridiales bacterium]